ncbi:MAG TPA: GtrA family protein [Polyangiaceae bacterium]|jgi:putative flippase GtrA
MSDARPSLAELVRLALGVRFLRFAVVGTSNAILSFAVFWLVFHELPALSARAGIAQLSSYAIGTGWSYFWNRRWTFASNQNVAREATRFVALQGIFAGLSSLLMYLAVDRSGLPKVESWLMVIALVTILNFFFSRYWVFKPPAAHA